MYSLAVALHMVAVDPTTAKLLKVTNAFDSPSIIKFNKDQGGMNPFDSPSCNVNGGRTDSAVDPSLSPSIIMLARKGTETYDALKSPSVHFLGLDEAKVKNAMSSPSLQITSESKTKLDMPLNLVIGQETIKSALILLAVNPKIGGVAISGGKGTGKSVMARALHRVMPPIEVVRGSEYNVSPEATNIEIDDFLRARLEKEGKQLADLEREIVPCPFVQVPVNVMEDRLFGSVDVKKTLETGQTFFTPGLLAAAHRGILYVDDLNLLDTDLATMMLQAVTDGFVLVEREGISVRYPCKPVLIATLNPEDSELKDIFLDRIGIALNADSEPLSLEERVQAVNRVLAFAEGRMDPKELSEVYEKEEQLKSAIVFAREYLKGTKISQDQLLYLCEEAVRGGCEGHRAEIAAARVATASAALEDAPVRADDLRTAVKLAIIPRSRFAQQNMDQEDMMPPPPPPPAPAPKPQNNLEDQKQNEDKEDDQEDNNEEDRDEDEEEDKEEQGEPSIPEEFIFDAVGVPMEDDMLKVGLVD
eukprot:scaffold919_cov153-Ochromonas_danica.AAC.9